MVKGGGGNYITFAVAGGFSYSYALLDVEIEKLSGFSSITKLRGLLSL